MVGQAWSPLGSTHLRTRKTFLSGGKRSTKKYFVLGKSIFTGEQMKTLEKRGQETKKRKKKEMTAKTMGVQVKPARWKPETHLQLFGVGKIQDLSHRGRGRNSLKKGERKQKAKSNP